MQRVWSHRQSVARSRIARRIAGILGTGLLLCLGMPACAWARPVPNLEFKDLAGHTERLRSLQGKIAVVNFWATWCAPCRAELPMLSRLNAEYASRGVEFVEISVDSRKDWSKIAPFMKQQHLEMPVWVGADLGTLNRLGFGNVVPATLVLDEKGDLVGRIEGEARSGDVQVYLDWLLGGRRGKAPRKTIKRY